MENDRKSMKLLAFVAHFEAEEGKTKDLLEKICSLKPIPQGIAQCDSGYLCRFELDNSITVENREEEKRLEEKVKKFLEKNGVVKGKLEYLEIGRWIEDYLLEEDRRDGCE